MNEVKALGRFYPRVVHVALLSAACASLSSQPNGRKPYPSDIIFGANMVRLRPLAQLFLARLKLIRPHQSALFNFQSLLLVILLLICTCTYIRAVAPRLIDSNKQGYVFSFLQFPRCACSFLVSL